MRKFIALLAFVFTLIFMSACTGQKQADIVTTMFPQYDFARQIVGDLMTVSLLVPPGSDIHSFEATSKDMVEIEQARLFIFTSLELDSWIKDPNVIGGDNTVVLDLSKAYTLTKHCKCQSDHVSTTLHSHDHHNCSDALHYWTDPTTAIQLIEAILQEIVKIDPENKDIYVANATSYIDEITNSHNEFKHFIKDNSLAGSKLFFAGHNAMGAFAARYHLNIISLFDDFKPDADLTSAELINFTNLVKENEARFLFIEELVDPKAARAIASQLKNDGYSLTLLELHGYHNVTQENFDAKVSYLDLLRQNIENLTLALQSSSEK